MNSNRFIYGIMVSIALSASSRITTMEREPHSVDPEHFIWHKKGNLPIILTAPHGGELAIAGVPKRTNPQGFDQFNTVIDDGTLEVTQALYNDIHQRLGAYPYVVAARFNRKYIDANRPANRAYENSNAQKVYEAYHGYIAAYIKEIKQRFPEGALLLDIHGHGRVAGSEAVIFRGTRNKTTVKKLIQRAGIAGLTGPKSVLGGLEAQGYEVDPAHNKPAKGEYHLYTGGYTVGAYGSQNSTGIDAIQLELGWKMRRGQEKRAKFAQALAQSVKTFYDTYLAPEAPAQAPVYHYPSESNVVDKRTIAILGYNDLVNQPTNPRTGIKLKAGVFNPTPITLPIALARKAQSGAITAVIDTQLGQNRPVYAALSSYQWLPNARNNLAAREEAPLRSQEDGYKLTDVFYMKKILPGRTKELNEQVIPGTEGWVIRKAASAQQQLPTLLAQKIVRWAQDNGITAVIWASPPATFTNLSTIAQNLINQPELLRATQEYVRALPGGALTSFEQAVASGAHALRHFIA